ncbi:MAG: AI-2E family transporter [Rhodobacteraceae bacterium]|nr:AI-2E family transporter [Paracoccaceae bacterium]
MTDPQLLPLGLQRTRGAVVLIGLSVAILTLWWLKLVLLMGFSAILLAILLDAASRILQPWLPLGRTATLFLVLLTTLLVGSLAIIGLGSQLVSSLGELSSRLPKALQQFEQLLNLGSIEDWLGRRLEKTVQDSSVVRSLSGASWLVATVLADGLVILAGGVFLALDPGAYLRTFLRFWPAHARPELQAALEAVADDLRQWLLGQLVAMAAVALLIWLGLWFLGLSSALALGAIAGLLEFIPYVGPPASALPALALGFLERPALALWVGLLYLIIQQIEGTLLMPLIQRQALNIPPAITIFAVFGFAALFGPMGVVLAAPLTVACASLLRTLWQPRMDALTPDPTAAPVDFSEKL